MATVVEFRTGIDDKVAYAARWLRKAAALGARAQVIGAAEDLQALDRALWVDDPQDFVPHAWLRQAGRVPGLERTPIWLGDGVVPPPGAALLLNLGAQPAEAVERFERVIEVVGRDTDDVQAGRWRWKAYLQLGLEPKHRQPDGAS